MTPKLKELIILISDLQSLKVEIDYEFFFVLILLGCPFCEYQTAHKTRTFKTLKQLTWHLANTHPEPGMYYPFTMEEVQQVLKVIAKAKEWRILK